MVRRWVRGRGSDEERGVSRKVVRTTQRPEEWTAALEAAENSTETGGHWISDVRECVCGGEGLGLLTTGWEGFQLHVADNTLSRTSQEAVLSQEQGEAV